MNKAKNELLQTEQDFAKTAMSQGIEKAFYDFAADSAVIDREKLIKGKKAIKEYYHSKKLTDAKLEWRPDYVDVSASGDMGYTYGKYSYSFKEKSGKTAERKGYFHTVWKKQKDGKWRFVWD